MEDKIFGKMTFYYGWIKTETIELWGNSYFVRIRTSSAQNDLPNELQQKAYTYFKTNLQKIAEESKKQVVEFVLSYSNDIEENLGTNSVKEPIRLIVPKEVLFFQNGKYAVIFDTKWSEAGMAILCLENNILEIGESYILEYEL